MKHQLIIACALAVALGMAPRLNAQQSAEQLYQSGVYKEEVEGELESAIEIFKQVVENHPQNRPIAAQALLHLGSSYEKLGNLMAQDAYQRLISEFGDQQAIVTEARMRLQEIRYRELAEGMQSKDTGPSFRIALDEDAPEIRPGRQYDFSPSGDQIVHQTWDGLYISDATGTLRRQLVAQSDDKTDWFIIYFRVGQPRWSPDGKQIAYFAGKRRPPGDDPNDLIWTIFVVDSEGGEPRKLVEFLDPEPYGGLYWTPDGNALTYLSLEGVQILDLEGKTVGQVDLDSNHPSGRLTGYSPDGRWLTFTRKADLESGNNRNTDIYLVPADGGDAVQLTFIPGYDGNAVWSSDSRAVYFISARGVEEGSSNIWKLQVDSRTGEPVGDPEQVTFFSDARIAHPQVVGDGHRIAFLLDKTKNSIHVAPDEHPDRYLTLARGVFPELCPDGQTVYYVGEGPDNEGIFSVSTAGGKPQRQTSIAPLVDQKHLSPDGNALAYFSTLDDERGLYVHPLSGEKPTLLTKTGCAECCTSPRWSPDGQSIAYAYLNGLFVISSSGGQPKEIATLHGWEAWTIRWSPDGQFIAALGYPEAESNNAVYVVPIAGGEPRLLSGLDEYKEGMEWHPDGQSLTYHLSKSKSDTYRTWLDGRPPELFFDKPDTWDYTGRWAPEGKRYFFINFADSEGFLDIYDTETGEFSHFARDPHNALPEWSADGKTITWTTKKSIRQLWLMENFK
ncbi:tetratricopeptide repeat protein [Candidatus Zixiibacteriota bacterium]